MNLKLSKIVRQPGHALPTRVEREGALISRRYVYDDDGTEGWAVCVGSTPVGRGLEERDAEMMATRLASEISQWMRENAAVRTR
jgi:hypothetical protein